MPAHLTHGVTDTPRMDRRASCPRCGRVAHLEGRCAYERPGPARGVAGGSAAVVRPLASAADGGLLAERHVATMAPAAPARHLP